MEVRAINANALLEKIRLREGPVMGQREIFLIEGEPTLTLNTLRDEIYLDAVVHGLWEHEDGPIACGMKIGEEMFELGEAAGGVIEAVKSGKDKEKAWEHYAEELADIVIICFSAAGHLKINIDAAIRRKMEINKSRPWKHGKEE